MRLLRTRTLTNEVDMHKNNEMRVLSTRTMAEDGYKHKNDAK